MRYRIAMPLSDVSGYDRLDLVDPVLTPESRSLAQYGLCDVRPSVHSTLLALFDERDGDVAFVDVGPGLGVASVLCARLFESSTVAAVVPDPASAPQLRRVAAANKVSIDIQPDLNGALCAVRRRSAIVLRIDATVEVSETIRTITTALPEVLPPVVISGDHDRNSWLEDAETSGYVVYPLRRFPSWKPLDKASKPSHVEGWLLMSTTASGELRRLHTMWAGAVGACTPDRNDRHPLLVELRSGFRSPQRAVGIVTLAVRDMHRSAKAAWHVLDPWMPPPRSRSGQLVARIVTRTRSLLTRA